MVIELGSQDFEKVSVGDGCVVQAGFGAVPGVTLETGDLAEINLADGDVVAEEGVWHGVFLFSLSMRRDRFKKGGAMESSSTRTRRSLLVIERCGPCP